MRYYESMKTRIGALEAPKEPRMKLENVKMSLVESEIRLRILMRDQKNHSGLYQIAFDNIVRALNCIESIEDLEKEKLANQDTVGVE